MPLLLPTDTLISALKESGVIPEVITDTKFAPSIQFDVVYGEKSVSAGDKLTKEETSQEPRIAFLDTDDQGLGPTFYTVAMADPDAPSRADPKYGQWRHWVQTGFTPIGIQALAESTESGQIAQMVNASEATSMPFANKNTAEALTPYMGPSPPPGSGLHRYCFLLFREPKDFAPTIQDLGATSNEFTARRKWNAIDFAKRNGLTLVGATFMQVEVNQ